ncbi:MAG: hypothetical protein H6567_12455 [Lewinellaceae bacterium]|nr:hypothetical protein [Lewinellaceae bacterium]
MNEKIKNILILIAYFIVAIVIFGSMGVWLPILIDNYNFNQVVEETNRSLPNNILTYSLGIFLIAIIDRIVYLLFKTSKYSNNVLEFFGIMFALFGTGVLVFLSLKSLKNTQIESSISYAKYVAFVAWFAWLYVKFQSTKTNNFSPIGGIL